LTIALLVGLTSVLQTTPAAACRANGSPWSPSAPPIFVIGAGTASESYRGIHGGIAIAAGTPDPDPNQLTDRHIAVSMNVLQANAQHVPHFLISQMGWQMGMLQELPSGTKTWAHSPTIFFEGLDNVGDYRTTYGAAETFGSYEVSWGGTSPTGRTQYNAFFERAGVWYQAGYTEFDNLYAEANAQAEATDASAQGTQNTACLQLSSSSANLHEHGVPSALLLLTDTWHDWTNAYPTLDGADNGMPYVYQNVSFPNFDHDRVGGP